jgi:hypothetical protein
MHDDDQDNDIMAPSDDEMETDDAVETGESEEEDMM